MNRHRIDRLLRPWGPRRITACLPHAEISLESVEEGIWPLVQALNRIDGVRTIASCHGHRGLARVGFDLVPWILRPYVFFEGPATFALTLSEQIDHAGWRAQLNYRWQVSGATHPELGQCIYLRVVSRFYQRRKLARDLAWLTNCVSNEMISPLRNIGDAVVQQEHEHQEKTDKHDRVLLETPPRCVTRAANVAERVYRFAVGAWRRDIGVEWTATSRILTKITAVHRLLQEFNRMKKKPVDDASISDSRYQKRKAPMTSTERTRRFRERLLNEGAARVDLHLAPAVAKLLDKECSRTGETLQAAIHRLIEQALRTRKAGRA